jgi:hypothetical protein
MNCIRCDQKLNFATADTHKDSHTGERIVFCKDREECDERAGIRAADEQVDRVKQYSRRTPIDPDLGREKRSEPATVIPFDRRGVFFEG